MKRIAILLASVLIAGCATDRAGRSDKARNGDAVDVSGQSWRFAKAPVENILVSASWAGPDMLRFKVSKPIPFPRRDANHDGKFVVAALMLVSKDGKTCSCSIESVGEGRDWVKLNNVTHGDRCKGWHPKRGEVYGAFLHSEVRPDRRTNILLLPPYP